ncbi:MAG: hypothetical protein ABS87_08890 [Sphingomonas sp. SCN 67-18]|uniref:DUF4230 domain-containing protein n=1 Tax=uncultured Sphingomonas sp. TaxID=158754 RepID=UPI00086DE26A|nr:DUF4230 domain-containing protein [Sphingomonas sp. SCN 67-18]ODU20865.1 MAG: hypothetical protein ABS87_08890 [Sphingomonas sp. SCN 67-18]
MSARNRWIGAAAAVALVLGGIWLLRAYVNDRLDPKPETIVATSLAGLREQNRLSSFAARYVAVVTSEQNRFGLSAKKTMIMPGMVRYEVDLSRLKDGDLRWDAQARQLTVTLPPIELSGPDVDLAQIREYDGGGLLMSLTDAEKQLDSANRARAREDLLKQAQAPLTMRLARDATRRAVENNFALPLRAAGVDATVRVRFADEGDNGPSEQMDRSRPVQDILGEGGAR